MSTIAALLGSAASGAAGLLVSISPARIATQSHNPGYATRQATAIASGGSGSYTFSWVAEAFGGSISIDTPNAAITSFFWDGLAPDESGVATATVTVTDTVTGAAATGFLSLSHNRLA